MEGTLHLLWMISWQAAILAVLVFAVTRLGGRAPAAWRYALWIIVAAKFVIPPFVDLPNQYLSRGNRPISQAVRVLVSPTLVRPTQIEMKPGPQVWVQGDVRPPEPPGSISLPDPINVLGGIWLLGMLIMIVRLIRRYSLQAGIRRGSIPAEDELAALLKECAIRLGMNRVPGILLSGNTCTPMLIGLLRPTIILPIGVTDVCGKSDLTAILMHELAHVKRRDMAALWLHQIVQTVFFFHPAAWLVGRELKTERELACDELVLSTPGIERIEYAAGYLSAVKFASRPHARTPGLSMSESFEVEKRRLTMILNRSIPKMSAGWAAVLLVVVAVGIPTFGIGDPTPSKEPPPRIADNREPVYDPDRPSQSPTSGEQAPPTISGIPAHSPAPPVVDAQGIPVPPTSPVLTGTIPENPSADDGPVYRYIPKPGNVRNLDERPELLRDAAFDPERLNALLQEIREPGRSDEPPNSILSAANGIVDQDPKRAAALFKAGLRYSPTHDSLLGGLCRSYSYMGQYELAISAAEEAAANLKNTGRPISNIVQNLLHTHWSQPVPSDSFKWLRQHREQMAPNDYVYVAKRWVDYKQLDQALEWVDAGIERANRGGWPASEMRRAEEQLFAPDTYELRLKWLGILRKQASAKLVLMEAKKRHPNYPFIENVPEIQDIHTANWKATDEHKSRIKPLPDNPSGSSQPLAAVIAFGIGALDTNNVGPEQIALMEKSLTTYLGTG